MSFIQHVDLASLASSFSRQHASFFVRNLISDLNMAPFPHPYASPTNILRSFDVQYAQCNRQWASLFPLHRVGVTFLLGLPSLPSSRTSALHWSIEMLSWSDGVVLEYKGHVSIAFIFFFVFCFTLKDLILPSRGFSNQESFWIMLHLKDWKCVWDATAVHLFSLFSIVPPPLQAISMS